MDIQPTGDRFRYAVRSQSHPRSQHLVDLLAHAGRGECSCMDYRTRRWPVIRGGGRAYCRHLLAVREYFLDALLYELALRETEPQKR